jgi:hypothetical protein
MIEVSSAEEATKALTSGAETPRGGLLDSEQTPTIKGKKGKQGSSGRLFVNVLYQ